MIAKSKYDLIKRPLLTEKAVILSEEYGKYVFEVVPAANKLSVKKTIEDVFKVKVKAVNILNQNGKTKKFKGTIGRRSDVKKAIVTLEKDQNIDFGGGMK